MTVGLDLDQAVLAPMITLLVEEGEIRPSSFDIFQELVVAVLSIQF